MMKLSRDRVQVPAAMLILGTGLAAAVLVGQGWHNAILVEVVAVIAAVGYFLLGGLNNDVGAIYGSNGGDERQQMVRLRAQALTGVVTVLAAVIGFLVQIARRAPTWPFGVVVGVAAASFVVGLAIYRVHDTFLGHPGVPEKTRK
jgi:hypothetical protein